MKKTLVSLILLVPAFAAGTIFVILSEPLYEHKVRVGERWTFEGDVVTDPNDPYLMTLKITGPNDLKIEMPDQAEQIPFTVSWTPDANDIGTHDISFRASEIDPRGVYSNMTHRITVKPAKKRPVFRQKSITITRRRTMTWERVQ